MESYNELIRRCVEKIDGSSGSVTHVDPSAADMLTNSVGKQHGDLFQFSQSEYRPGLLPPGEWSETLEDFKDFVQKATRSSGMMSLKEIFKQFCKFDPGTQSAHTISSEPNFISISGDEWLRIFVRHSAMALRSLELSKQQPVDFLRTLIEKDLHENNFSVIKYPYDNLTHVFPLPPLLQPRVVQKTSHGKSTAHINDAVYFREAQILGKEYDEESYAHEGNMISSKYFSSIFRCTSVDSTFEVSPFIAQSEHFSAYVPLVYETTKLFSVDKTTTLMLTDLLVEVFLRVVALKFKAVYDGEALQKLRQYITSAASPYVVPLDSIPHLSDIFRTVFYRVPKLIIGALSPQYEFHMNSPFLSIVMSALTLYSIKKAFKDVDSYESQIHALIDALTTFALTCETSGEKACEILRVTLRQIQALVDKDLEIIFRSFAPLYTDVCFNANAGRPVQSVYGTDTETIWYSFVEFARRVDHIRWIDAVTLQFAVTDENRTVLRDFASSILEAAYLHLNALAGADQDLMSFDANLVGGDYTQFYDHKKSIERQLDFERTKSTHSIFSAVNIATSMAFSIVCHGAGGRVNALTMNSHIQRPADLLRIYSTYGSMLYTEAATSITSSFGTTAIISDRNKFNRIRFSIYLMHFKTWLLDGIYWWTNYPHITSDYELMEGVLSRYDDLRERFFPGNALEVPSFASNFVSYPISGPFYLMTVAASIQHYVSQTPTLLRTFMMSLLGVAFRDYFPFCCISHPTETMIYNAKFRDSTLDKYVIFSSEFERVLASLPVAATEQTISRIVVDVYNEVICSYINDHEYVQKYVLSELGPGFVATPIESIYLPALPQSQSFLVDAVRWFLETTSDHTKLDLLVKIVYYALFIDMKLNKRATLKQELIKIHNLNIHQHATETMYGDLLQKIRVPIFSLFYQTHPSTAVARNDIKVKSQVERAVATRCRMSLEDLVAFSSCLPISALFDDASVLLFYNNNVTSDAHNVFRWVDDPQLVMLYRDVIVINLFHSFCTLLAQQTNDGDPVHIAVQYLSGIKQTLPINSVCMGPEWRSVVAEAMNLYPDIAPYWCRYLSLAFDTDLMISAVVKAVRYDWDYAQYVSYVFESMPVVVPVISVRKKLTELSERYNLTMFAPISVTSHGERKVKPIAQHAVAKEKEVVDQSEQHEVVATDLKDADVVSKEHQTDTAQTEPNPFCSFYKLPRWAQFNISRVNQIYAPETDLGNELKNDIMREMSFLSTHGCRFWSELYIDNGILSSKSLI